MFEYLNDNPTFLLIFFFSAVGYWVASGAARANYKTLHVALGIALFFLIGLGTYYFIKQYFDIHIVWRIIIAGFVIIATAYIWRRWWAEPVFQKLRNWSVTTTSFGPSKTWDMIESVPKRKFHYYRVELEDGTQMGSDTEKLQNMDEKDDECPSEMIIDEEGNVALFVTEIWKKGKKKPIKNNFIDEHGRIEYTYIPASKIRMIQAYFKHDKKRR